MSKLVCRSTLALGGLVALAVLAGCGGGRDPLEPQKPSAIKQLTATDTVYEANPTYAPDGTGILYESDATGDREIWLLPADGTAARRLTENPAEDTAPCWLPDASGFVFESTRSGTKSIWRQDLTHPGSAPVQLTDDVGDEGSPDVSPDGQFVVYESNRSGAGQDLWLTSLTGGEPIRLTVAIGGSYDRTADWSPDGKSIVFESDRKDGLSALYTIPAKGGSFVRLTELGNYEGHPAWSPDGTCVAFEGNASGTMEIWCIGADGSGVHSLTTDGGYWPNWNPTGSKLVYCNWGSLAPNLWEIMVP